MAEDESNLIQKSKSDLFSDLDQQISKVSPIDAK